MFNGLLNVYLLLVVIAGWMIFKITLMEQIFLPALNHMLGVTSNNQKIKANSSLLAALRYGLMAAFDLYIFSGSYFSSYFNDPLHTGILWRTEDDFPDYMITFWSVQFGVLIAETFDWLFFTAPLDWQANLLHHAAEVTLFVFALTKPWIYPAAVVTLICTDISDVPLFTAKWLHHLDCGCIVNWVFGPAILVYLAKTFMLVVLFLTILRSGVGYWQQPYCLVFYAIITALNAWWCLLLLKIGWVAITGGELDEPEHIKKEIVTKSGVEKLVEWCGSKEAIQRDSCSPLMDYHEPAYVV